MDIADYCDCTECEPAEPQSLLASREFWIGGALSVLVWAIAFAGLCFVMAATR